MAGTHDHTSENNMTDQPQGCESSAMLSRRGFLKGIGALALGGVAAKAMIAPEVAEAAERANRDLSRLLELTSSSPLFHRAVKELSAHGYVFKLGRRQDYSPDLLLRSATAPHLVGLALAPSKRPANQDGGANLFVTADFNADNLSGITYFVARVNSDGVAVIDDVTLLQSERIQKHHKIDPQKADSVPAPRALATSKTTVRPVPDLFKSVSNAGAVTTLVTCTGPVRYNWDQCCKVELCAYPTYKCTSYYGCRNHIWANGGWSPNCEPECGCYPVGC